MQSNNPEDYLHQHPEFVGAIVQHFKNQSLSMSSNKNTIAQESKYVI
jgi:hypothetical protein